MPLNESDRIFHPLSCEPKKVIFTLKTKKEVHTDFDPKKLKYGRDVVVQKDGNKEGTTNFMDSYKNSLRKSTTRPHGHKRFVDR